MQQENNKKSNEPILSFHLMKFAFQDYQKNICNLSEQEYLTAYQHANEEMLLHQIILTSKEACCVVVPEALLDKTLLDIMDEYPSKDHFHTILQENNIPLTDYTVSLHNDLRVETILARVACSIQSVTFEEMFRYFNNNKTDFHKPEQRNANQIRITYDPSSSAETDAALRTIEGIYKRVLKRPESFFEEAKLFSACNTQDEESTPDLIAAGEMCSKLDKALFSLSSGGISPIIESENGFILLHCTQIHPVKNISFREASPAIFSILLKKKQLNACRIWLQKLVQLPNQDPNP